MAVKVKKVAKRMESSPRSKPRRLRLLKR